MAYFAVVGRGAGRVVRVRADVVAEQIGQVEIGLRGRAYSLAVVEHIS